MRCEHSILCLLPPEKKKIACLNQECTSGSSRCARLYRNKSNRYKTPGGDTCRISSWSQAELSLCDAACL